MRTISGEFPGCATSKEAPISPIERVKQSRVAAMAGFFMLGSKTEASPRNLFF